MKNNRWIKWGVFAVAFAYFAALAAKSYTWVFVSSDSGGWLAAATRWMVPQPYGSPLYVLLSRLLHILPTPLPATLTLVLSCLPAAITVALVYLIVLRLTSKSLIALVSSAVLMGSAVFLSQATVLEEYALTVMFVTMAFYCYVRWEETKKVEEVRKRGGKSDRGVESVKEERSERKWKYWTVVFLGLGTAVHVTVALIALFWLLAVWGTGRTEKTGKRAEWRAWVGKPLLVYVLIGLVPYSLVPILMALDTPRFLAGGLNLHSLIGYWSNTGRAVVGTISVFEFPLRLFSFAKIVLTSFGLALIPLLYYKIYKPLTTPVAILLGTIMCILWYVLTCLDAQAWTFLVWASPPIAILVGLGLSKLRKEHVMIVGVGALVLIGANGVFLNANTLTHQDPRATAYLSELNALPDGSVVVVTPGPYSLGLFYDINLGKDLVPLIYPYLDLVELYSMEDYGKFLEERWEVQWSSTLGGVEDSLRGGRGVYLATIHYSVINRCFIVEGDRMVKRIVGLTGLLPEPFLTERER